MMKAAALCKEKLADDGQGSESARSVNSGSEADQPLNNVPHHARFF
jgi:hypothetical protein